MSYFTVFQNKNFEEERKNGYIWAPEKGKDERNVPSWSLLKEVKEGDTIFTINRGQIVSVNKALGSYNSKSKAISIDNRIIGDCNNQQNSKNCICIKGFEVKLTYKELNNPIRIKDIFENVNKMLPKEHSPFNKNGGGNQGYLFRLTDQLGNYLIELMRNNQEDLNNVIIAGNEKISKSDVQNKQIEDNNNNKELQEMYNLFTNFESKIECFISKIIEAEQIHPYGVLSKEQIGDLNTRYISSQLNNSGKRRVQVDNIPFENLIPFLGISLSFDFILKSWDDFERYFNNTSINMNSIRDSKRIISSVRNWVMHDHDLNQAPDTENINLSRRYVSKYLEIFKKHGCS